MKVWQVGGDFGARFPPPPPRPPHLTLPILEGADFNDDDQFQCDLCSWARPNQKIPTPGKDSSNFAIFTSRSLSSSSSSLMVALACLTINQPVGYRWTWHRLDHDADDCRIGVSCRHRNRNGNSAKMLEVRLFVKTLNHQKKKRLL